MHLLHLCRGPECHEQPNSIKHLQHRLAAPLSSLSHVPCIIDCCCKTNALTSAKQRLVNRQENSKVRDHIPVVQQLLSKQEQQPTTDVISCSVIQHLSAIPQWVCCHSPLLCQAQEKPWHMSQRQRMGTQLLNAFGKC